MAINKSRSQGFTLVELLLVISIIAILSALGVSVLANAEQDALETRTRAGIERISNVLNQKLEAVNYRVLPARLPLEQDLDSSGTIEPNEITTPDEIRTFREQAMAEILRVEFPFLFVQVDSATTFPQNQGTSPPPLSLVAQYFTERPQITARYEARVNAATGATVEHQSAELLYIILSLNFDEFGQPLSAVLREREIGDTDNDGLKEVLDAFGDPLQFSLLVRLDQDDLDELTPLVPPQINRDELADVIGYESILSQTQALQPGQVRGPWPIQDYRIVIRSVNLNSTDHGAVVTQ